MKHEQLQALATDITCFFQDYTKEEIEEKLFNFYRGWVYGLSESAATKEGKDMLLFYEELKEFLLKIYHVHEMQA